MWNLTLTYLVLPTMNSVFVVEILMAMTDHRSVA